MKTFNPKKHNKDRRKRPAREEPKSSYVQVTSKSKSGVVYVHFVLRKTENPKGHNRAALRGILAKDKVRKIDYN